MCGTASHRRASVPPCAASLAGKQSVSAAAALTSIFFGGGTPSLMEPETVEALIEDARRLFQPADDIEITLEANPTSVEAGRFAAYRAAGVNRVSIGVQSLDAEALRLLGREHTAAQAIGALETGRAAFPRISFDLIYARPGQTLQAWRAELGQALSLAADHLSLYQLTIEPGTKFAALHRRGEIVLPDDDTAAALYEATAEEAARFGLLGYEVSNYASPGSESRHNLTYWRYGDYAGYRPGSARTDHPRARTVIATRRHRAPEAWAERVERDGHGIVEEFSLQPIERAREMLLMGLRLAEGIDPTRFAERTGVALDAALDQPMLQQSIEEGYLEWRDGRLAATPAGRLRLEALLGAIVL